MDCHFDLAFQIVVFPVCGQVNMHLVPVKSKVEHGNTMNRLCLPYTELTACREDCLSMIVSLLLSQVCPVCLEDFANGARIVVTPCCHGFHKEFSLAVAL